MTPANNGPNNGANAPEDDDPFGYLYADGQAAGATPPSQSSYGYPGGPTVGGQPGVPRTSYNQVRTVGDRRPAAPRQVPQQQAHYPAPETLGAGYGGPQQGYGQQPPQQYAPEPGHGGGRSRRGLLIAAVAVVGAVVIGIGVALITDNKGKDKGAEGPSDKVSQAPATPGKTDPTKDTGKDTDKGALPKADAASGSGLTLAGGATVQSDIKGAQSADGKYVGGFNAVGASLTWTVDAPAEGDYKLRMTYSVPGTDANATVTVNGVSVTKPINMKNYSGAPAGDWEKGWTNTWGQVTLNKGTNTIKVSCEQGNSCDAIIDRVWLAPINS
ncbi:CBM35 domain-containing protein [Streptomyces sp. NPDC089919]|uniref:CBM35 domain-containing protein n=1 Tax=Streptomyces sp. NPDC089919 TaxID=3155188 RepID=UPI0034274F73